MSWTRKVVSISYETSKTVTRNGSEYPETKLLTVGSAFIDSGRVTTTLLTVYVDKGAVRDIVRALHGTGLGHFITVLKYH